MSSGATGLATPVRGPPRRCSSRAVEWGIARAAKERWNPRGRLGEQPGGYCPGLCENWYWPEQPPGRGMRAEDGSERNCWELTVWVTGGGWRRRERGGVTAHSWTMRQWRFKWRFKPLSEVGSWRAPLCPSGVNGNEGSDALPEAEPWFLPHCLLSLPSGLSLQSLPSVVSLWPHWSQQAI